MLKPMLVNLLLLNVHHSFVDSTLLGQQAESLIPSNKWQFKHNNPSIKSAFHCAINSRKQIWEAN